MFQYAAGRALAHEWQTELKLDLSFFAGQTLRAYSLEHFNIHPQFASPDDVARLMGTSGSWTQRWVSRLAQALSPASARAVITERRYLHYDPQLFGAVRDVYLIGYWQNERYFAAEADRLRSEFALTQALLPQNAALTQQIAGTTAVGVHVRRGDYVANARTDQLHGVCSVDYYQACAQSVLNQIPNAHFFVFSDDPEWVKAHLLLGGPTTIIAPASTDRDCEQLLLLSQCQHLILANSTFSWWATWLGNRPNRLVYAPLRWFAQGQFDTTDFIPDSWIRM